MNRESIAAHSHAKLEEITKRNLRRQLNPLDSPQGVEIVQNGVTLINFSSNDYLGLATHPALKEAAAKAAIDLGVGSGASRLVTGSLPIHSELEAVISEFKQTQAALTFSSGYAAALGTIPALVGKDDMIILDKLSHACLVDGARLSGAKVRVYKHNDMDQLEDRLRWARTTHPQANVLVVTEAVFSMDGDMAPLREMVALKQKFGVWLMVDEAHALGVVGKQGEGLALALGLNDQIDVQMGTLSKAIGSSGGYICGSRSMIDLLINSARSFIYSTAPPPPAAAAAISGITIMQSPEGLEKIRCLHDNTLCILKGIGLHATAAHVPAIIPVITGDESKALEVSQILKQRGFMIPAIRFPTVAKNAARLRITVSAAHRRDQIQKLIAQIREILC